MARRAGGLDVKTVEALRPREKTYRVSDGGGLLLEVGPNGSKAWLCRLTVDGKRRDMGLGAFPVVTLAAARRAALAARQAAQAGIDPIAARKADREARDAAREAAQAAKTQADAETFAEVAEACIKAMAPGWKNARTADQWRANLRNHVFPVLGKMPVADIDRAAVLRAIEDVWATRPVMARKALQRVGVVLRYAAAHGMRANDNPADVKMLRHAGLPALAGGQRHPSLPWGRVPAFMAALDPLGGLAPLALRLAVLTALRSGEVRGARWSELTFQGGAVWTIPGERMKGRKAAGTDPHRVPLSPAALATLARAYGLVTGADPAAVDLPKVAARMGNALIFPSSTLTTPLSDMALSAVVRRMNETAEGEAPPWRDLAGRPVVPHGFRASFRTWVDDTRPEDAEAAERALAHEVASKVQAAYRRSDLLDRRRPLMEAWGRWCTGEGPG